MGAGLLIVTANNKLSQFDFPTINISPFQHVFRRYTNFAIESIEQKFMSEPVIGERTTAIISHSAELCHTIWLEITLPTVDGATNRYIYGVGNAFIKSVEIDIGGQIIDMHTNEWLNITGELKTPTIGRRGYDASVGNYPSNSWLGGTTRKLYIPLRFWFCNSTSMALPLIALSQNTVKLNFQFASLSELTRSGTITDADGEFSCRLYVDYIFLDTDEKRRFTHMEHDYLIEQIQYAGDNIYYGDTIRRLPMDFRRPVKEICWTFGVLGRTELFHYDDSNDIDVNYTATILLNGQPRFVARDGRYFRLVQNAMTHTNNPRTGVNRETIFGVTSSSYVWHYNQFIYTYSFALHPEKMQPSGYCNFSRIDKSTLYLTFNNIGEDYVCKIYAVGYNILHIAKGTAALLY